MQDLAAPPAPKGRLLAVYGQLVDLSGKEPRKTPIPSTGTAALERFAFSDDGSGPLANALVDLDMLVWTEGQQYSAAGLRSLLEAAGFGEIEIAPTSGYWSLASARR